MTLGIDYIKDMRNILSNIPKKELESVYLVMGRNFPDFLILDAWKRMKQR
jgi:hypothetical protein